MAKLPVPFDNPHTYPGHSGVDYPKPRGTVFRASGNGQVVSLGRNSRGGFYIWVQYDGGPLVGYHHMDSHNGCPPLRSFTRDGTQLGFVGSLGQFSTGPHLHSEVAGNATTAGYWKFFDSTRVVGQGSGGGTTPPNPGDDDMSVQDIYDARDGDGRNMLDLARQIRADLTVVQAALTKEARLNASADYQAFAQMSQRAFRYDVRPLGVGADYKLGATVFESLAGAQNTPISEAQVKQIADAVVAAVGKPTVTIDYEAIAKRVNDVADERSLKRYTK